MIRTRQIEGIVLRRQNLGEADRILTILSKESGKIQVKAPGVRRIPSRRSAHIELLNLSRFSLYTSSRAFMPLVTEASTLDSFSSIKTSLSRIGAAFYICERVNGLCPDNQDNVGVFFNLKSTFSKLENMDPKLLVKNFERSLLEGLGFWAEAELLKTQDSSKIMERLMERRLKTTRIIPLFA